MNRKDLPVLGGLAVAGLLAFAAVSGLRYAGLLTGLELKAYDWQTVVLASEALADGAHVTLVSIDERDLRRLGHWPLTDQVLADVLDRLASLGPAVIGLDLYRDISVPAGSADLDRYRAIAGSPGSADLDEVFTTHAQIVGVSKFADETGLSIPAPAVLERAGRAGFNDVLVDDDGTVRRGLLVLSGDDGSTSFAFSLVLAAHYLAPRSVLIGNDPDDPELIRIGSVTVPRFSGNDGGYVRADAAGYQYLVNYADREHVLPTFRLSALLDGRIPRASVAGKIVLLGSTAESIKDLFYLPARSRANATPAVQGVVLHGLLTNQLVRMGLGESKPVHSFGEAAEIAWILAWCMVGAAAGHLSRSPGRMVLVVAAGVAAAAGSGVAALQYSWWIPVVPPALGWIGAIGLVTALALKREGRERQYLKGLFERHVSPEVADMVWEHRDELLARGHLKVEPLTVTMLFSDLEGFTSVGEKLEPAALIGWLNDYMECMVPIVFDHGGLIVQFVGDALHVAFGAPIPRTTEPEIDADAESAVRCALAMEAALIRLNQDMLRRDLPPLGMRIGILTGPAVGGSIGSRQRIEYNVQGDTVNTASRLESYDKENFKPDYLVRPCRILVGETTVARLHTKLELEDVGELSLQGKALRLRVFRLYGMSATDPCTESGIDCC